MAAPLPQLSDSWEAQSQQPGFHIEKLNVLSFPKGKECVCELTGTNARIAMVTPYITLYFATKDDAELSWTGIMHKICSLLGPLRQPPAVIGSEEERARRQYTLQMSKRALIDLTKTEAAKFLAAGQYVIPPARRRVVVVVVVVVVVGGGGVRVLW